MTICTQCLGKGATYSDTDFILDSSANTNQQNNTLAVVTCSQCGGKGYLTNFGVA